METQEPEVYNMDFTAVELLEIYEGLGQAHSKHYPGMDLESLISVRTKIRDWFAKERSIYLR